jgi:hypothetical protein
VRAIRLFAELAGRIGRYADAETCCAARSSWTRVYPARANLALVLYRTNRAAEALEQLAQVTTEDGKPRPRQPGCRRQWPHRRIRRGAGAL